MNMRDHLQAGFTLIELMIVVAIIGILAAIAMPQYGDYVSRARASGAVSELNSVKLAIVLCYQYTGNFAGCSTSTSDPLPVAAISGNLTTISSVDATTGAITATSTATDGTSAATQLTIIDTPTAPAGNSNMVWKETGTICNVLRGLKPGQGDC